MSLNRYKLRHLAQTKHKAARRVEKLLARPDRLLGLILIGNNLVNILASAIATIVCIRLFGDIGVAVATFGLTLVVLVFGEVTPKTLAAMFPERIAYPASWVLKGLMVPFAPWSGSSTASPTSCSSCCDWNIARMTPSTPKSCAP